MWPTMWVDWLVLVLLLLPLALAFLMLARG